MPPRKFAPEFKKRVVMEFEAGDKSSAQICRDFRVSDSCLYRWVAQYREQGESAWSKTEPDAQELLEARKRVAELEGALGRATLEADFLKRCLKQVKVPLP